MARILLRRLRDILLVLILVTFFTTALVDLLPGSPALAIYGSQLSPSFIAKFNEQFGLNHSLPVRYWNWIWHALHGNLGMSYATHFTVSSQLVSRLPVTVEIAVLSMFVSLLLAVPVGLISAVRPGKLVDRLTTGITSVTHALPPFVSAVIIVYLFAVKARWLPSQGWVPLTQSVGQNLTHVIMPVATLVLVVAPIFIRILRGDVVSILSEDFVAVARSRGLPEWYVLFRHVLRPASASLVTVAGIAFGSLLGGALIVENFFGLPGLGQLASQAVSQKDLPILQGVVVCAAIVFVLINAFVDVSYGLLDPRVRGSR